MSGDIKRVNQTLRFVADTTTIISYFNNVFGVKSKVSKRALNYLDGVFRGNANYVMIIPSVVFIEIFDKWFRETSHGDEEFRAKFIAEVYRPIKSNPNIEIREIDFEVLEMFLTLDDGVVNLENRDKVIFASAIVLDACLITSDRKLKKYYSKFRRIPALIT